MLCQIEYAIVNLSSHNIFSRFHKHKMDCLFILPRPRAMAVFKKLLQFRLSTLLGLRNLIPFTEPGFIRHYH